MNENLKNNGAKVAEAETQVTHCTIHSEQPLDHVCECTPCAPLCFRCAMRSRVHVGGTHNIVSVDDMAKRLKQKCYNIGSECERVLGGLPPHIASASSSAAAIESFSRNLGVVDDSQGVAADGNIQDL